jgi:hypothetical protein
MANDPVLADPEQVRFMQKRLDDQINDFRNEGSFYRMKAFSSTVIVIIFSGITTVLIGFGQKGILENYREILSMAALITSAVTSGFSSWESFFSYRSRWVSFNEAASDASTIREQLEYVHVSGKLTQSKLDEFFKEFQHVRDTAHTGWTRNRGGKRK